MAEYAREDKKLIPNHSEGRGIPVILKEELNECQEIHDLLINDKNETEFVQSLSCDIKELKHALTAYN